MKYSMACLDKALLIMLPSSKVWPNSINYPARVDMAAKEFFMYPEKFKGQDEIFAAFVVREAMIELATVGWMTFGDIDNFWC